MSIPKAPIGQGALGPRAGLLNLNTEGVLSTSTTKKKIKHKEPKKEKKMRRVSPQDRAVTHRLSVTRTQVINPEESISVPFPAFLYSNNLSLETKIMHIRENTVQEGEEPIIEVLNFES